MQETKNLGYPNQQQYRYRSVAADGGCNEAANYDGCFSGPDSVQIWDNRISKRFKLWRNQSVEGLFDLFNTLNVNTITNQTNRNGSTYLQPTEIIAPRVFRLGVRYKF